MDINQNQQTNTFVKGMNTDTSDMYLSSDQYRYAENVRVVTNEDSNSGELHLIEGTTEYKEIKGQYIIASDYIRDIAVFITVNNNTAPTTWSVYKIENDTTCLMFGPSPEKIWNDNTTLNDIRKSITTVMRYESPENIKLYIADSTGKHSIMCLNVSGEGGDNSRYHGKTFDEVFSYQRTLLPPPTVEISNGSGNIMSGRVQYAYRLYSKNNPATQISILSKVLNLYKNEYSGYEAEKPSGRAVDITLDVQSQQGLDYIQIYRISYQLSGQLPKISLIKDEKISNKLRDSGSDISEVAISDFLSMATSSIIPSQIESKGDYLFAANMKYSQDNVDNQFPDFDARSYSTGNTYAENSIRNRIFQYNSISGYTIPSNFNNNYDQQYIGHYQFDQENISQFRSIYWENIYFDTPIYYNIGPSGDISITDSTPSNNINLNVINNKIENNNTLYVNISSTNQNDITFQLILYYYISGDSNLQQTGPGDTIILENGSDIIQALKEFKNNTTGFSQFDTIVIHPNLSSYNFIGIYENNDYCNGYGKCICWRYIYDPIDITAQDQGDVQYQKFTFRCGETYRFGVRLFDEHGNASSVKWIADIMIPDGANMYNDNSTIKFRNVGIEFFKTPGSELLWGGISGWEIVRCERTLQDRKAITQGVVGFPLHEYHVDDGGNWTDTGLICNPGVLTTELMYVRQVTNDFTKNYGNFAVTDNNVVIIGTPEYCYQSDDIQEILTSYINQLYSTKIYECIPKFENSEGAYFRSVQNENSNMAFEFYINNPEYILWEENSRWCYSFSGLYTGNTGYLQMHNDQENKGTRWYINYFSPNYSNFVISTDTTKYNFDDISFIDSPKPSDFAQNEQLIFKNNVVTINNLSFINWTTPLLLNASGQYDAEIRDFMNYSTSGYAAAKPVIAYPIGSGGKAILLKQTGNKIAITNADYFDGTHFGNHIPTITVININKNTTPYGGYNKSAIDNSSYISFGDYTTEDNIYVYSGDTYNRIFTYNSAHNWYDSTYKNCVKMASVYAIPVETDIDIRAQYGILYDVGQFSDYRIQDIACAFDNYTQDKNSYMYNPAYNATPDIVSWTTPEQLESKQDYFDTRIHFSNVKTNNEDIDSWLQFAPSNYRDVDSRYGEITDLKLFKDRLIFWQENATGVLAVNERVVLNDQNDTQVVLGTGGVLERYDYITTIYGQKKNQHARVVTNDSLYWWDGNNKEILVHQQKFDSTPLSTIKYIKNYINEKDESDTPFISYDNKYKEVLFNVVNNQSLVYNEQIQAFTGIYTFNPLYDFILNGDLYLTDDSTVYKYNDQYINQTTKKQESKLFKTPIHPLVRYVVNKEPVYTKAYDIQLIGGRFYGGGFDDDLHERNNDALEDINLIYKTPLKQEGRSIGTDMTNVEYDYRITVPRAGYKATEDDQIVWKVKEYGDRLRGKIMRCEINSDNSNPDFSLQYVTTKFRMSWN